MRLDKDPEMFRRIITNVALKQNILEVYVEKDYWLYLILKEIFKNNENGYVFKGGTSLSKCFHLINRFSEDIDISYSTSYEELTVGGARKKFEDIIKAIERAGLNVSNRENLRSRRYFNQFLCPYESIVEKQNDNIERKVIVELAAQTPSFPSETKEFSSFIYDYFKSIDREDLIEKYDLKPFPIQVQTLERTLVDKTFAICDYYISDNIKQHSRHIYDISKLLSVIDLNESLAKLFLEVREYRNKIPICLSARDGIKLNEILNNIISLKSFKADFEKVTYQFLYEDYTYKKCEESLMRLKDFLSTNNL